MTTPAVRAREIGLRRDGRAILEDVSLRVRPDEHVLIRGPSGAGKTSLFGVLGLLEPPTAGSLEIGGEAVPRAERDRARIRREEIGIVFQEFELIPDLTARENVALPQQHDGTTDPAWIDHLFDRLQMDDLADREPPRLSGGERQRVAIARALSNRPRLLLCDEPTGQLDPETAASVRSLLLDVSAETGAALVVISHDPLIGEDMDTVYRLVDGHLRPDRAEG